MSFDTQVIELALHSLESRAPLPASVRSSSPAQVKSLVHELEETRATWESLAAVEHRVKLLTRSWHERYVCLTNAVASISRLPVEVLQEVFQLDVGSSANTRRAIVLGSVCRKWRDVAHQTTEFWSTIRLPSVHASILPSLVVRTKNNPFSLRLYNPRLDEPTTKLRLTPSDARRLTSISLVSDDPRRLPSVEIIPPEAEKEFHLEKVEIVQESFELYERVSSWMTSTKELVLVKTILDNSQTLTFHRLREVCISDVSGTSASKTLRALNLHAPCLEKICLRGILDHDSMSDPTAVGRIPVELASAITHLTLDKCYTDGWAPFVGQVFPLLRVFETKQRKALASCEYIRTAWWNIIRESPNLEVLDMEIEDSMLPFVFNYIGPDPSGVPHGRIEEIRIVCPRWDWWDPHSEKFQLEVCGYFRHKWVEALPAVSGALPLSKLVLSKEFVQGMEEWVRGTVCELVLV